MKNKSNSEVIEEFREKFTRESPTPNYREMKHEYYLNSTEVEQFILYALNQQRKDLLREIKKIMEGHNFDIEFLAKFEEFLTKLEK